MGERMAGAAKRLGYLAFAFGTGSLASCGAGSGAGSGSGEAGALLPDPAGTCSRVSYAAPSGSANDITFAFDKPYPCGQFATGDWWVSAESAGGSVTITAISPPAADGRNGFEVNPAKTREQAFDSTADTAYSATLMPALPLRASGVSSVVKSVSVPGTGRPQLQFAAVLTVVDAPIADSATLFRPGYFGTTKVFYDTRRIRSADLPKYNATGVAGAGGLSFASIAARYRHVQLDHISSWTGRDTHPKDNMPDYGANIARDNAVFLMRLLLDDFDAANSQHRQALINYLQMAIDLQAMAAGGATWPGDGGHLSGRKLPLLFAARALDDARFNDAIAVSSFAEDNQVWYSNVAGMSLFGMPGSDSRYWSTTRGLGGAKDVRDPYGYIDGGGHEIGAGYQFCCTTMPWKHTVLALYLLGLEDAWDPNRVLINYVERWVSTGTKAQPDPCAPYDGVPSNYGITYGPNGAGGCILDTDPSDGIGRWPAKDGANANLGHYGSDFGDALWDWYKAR